MGASLLPQPQIHTKIVIMESILSVEHKIHTREQILQNYADKEAVGNTLTDYERQLREKCEQELPDLRDAAKFIAEHVIFC